MPGSSHAEEVNTLMGRTIAVLDPVTRVEGHLRVQITVCHGRVEVAKVQGTMYRGLENVLVGKHPDDARLICQRVCGVCPTSHGLAAVKAVECMGQAALPPNAHVLRNLLLGAELLHSHILHFYHLCLPDYIEMPTQSPWGPSFGGDRRVSPEDTNQLISHYREGFRQRRNAHTLGAVVGGKMPHPAGMALGGMTTRLSAQERLTLRGILDELDTFVQEKMIPDVDKLAAYYQDYVEIGRGTGEFLCLGAFYDPLLGRELFPAGHMRIPPPGGHVLPVDTDRIQESAYFSWYADEGARNPFDGATEPDKDKERGYSWIKAPRYKGKACEVGPYARLAMLGLIDANSSVMGRILARVVETRILVKRMKDWLEQYEEGGQTWQIFDVPDSGMAVGRAEAPRGSLAHYVVIRDRRIHRYQMVTPTSWNCSPRDGSGLPGVLEQAIQGTTVEDKDEPIEVLRIVHSFDPCMACSVH
jgi:hydrogenase large subunit